MTATGQPALLEVDDLVVNFGTRRERRRGLKPNAVDGVSLTVGPDETLAVVGESGSGKTTVARCVVGLQAAQRGTVRFDGVQVGPVGTRTPATRRAVQMVFQDPAASLNPRMTVRAIIAEAWRTHRSVAPTDRTWDAAIEDLLNDVGLDAGIAARRTPSLSGGQCQRVSIARALALRPRLLVCDEAVSALDVSVQSQILRLLVSLRASRGLAILFITHDLGVVRQIADRVAVMQHGRLVETASADDLFDQPSHPYTRTLLDAALDLEGA
ncbi:ABC transporter ATP-binding protein [Plantactinospora sp. KLBMP9567]|uniref:ABC transporter ATP-binding protein n=1 Tax=Plantactinospora sp. KLBMP9567 TaxID=3085900 RepID=UPI0029814301|nr:ABC transporter ATP-binding protein [Plantactinospora sp. KLBMP9567]MDW5324428.1 ABC transporter ATP-binding protein [Plantactinospora sp. KLBMP9567]